MPRKDWYPKLVEKVIEDELEAMDRLIKDFIEPIGDIGNPEKLIGKSYAHWTPEDLQRLISIYGEGKDTPLTRTIFNREYEELKRLEEENAG